MHMTQMHEMTATGTGCREIDRHVTQMTMHMEMMENMQMNEQHMQMKDQHMQMDNPMQGPLKLKNGSFVFINEKGTMRMTDKNGKSIKMKENVEMEMMDGSLIMMKNAKLWRHDHRKTK